MSTPRQRPEVLTGATYKIRIDASNGKITCYITINNDEDGKPFEVFINSKNTELAEHLAALTVMLSRMLQNGIDVADIVNDLSEIASPYTGHLIKGGWCPSIYARIGKVLESHNAKGAK